MSSVIRDPLIEMVTARWDCVNASGPCDCTLRARAAQSEGRTYSEARAAAKASLEAAQTESDLPPRASGTWLHRLFVALAEWTR